MKGFLQLSALNSGVPTLFMKLAVFSGILRLKGCGHGWRSSEHGMSPNLYEDASSVGSKLRVICLELQPPFPGARVIITTIQILIPRDPSLLRGVGIISADLCGANVIRGLSQGLSQRGLFLFSQGELEMAAPETVQEEGVCHPVFEVWN